MQLTANLIQESNELQQEILKLNQFVETGAFHKLHGFQKLQLYSQVHTMLEYLKALNVRTEEQDEQTMELLSDKLGDEAFELECRITRLEYFMETEEYKGLRDQQKLAMHSQLDAMQAYRTALRFRFRDAKMHGE